MKDNIEIDPKEEKKDPKNIRVRYVSRKDCESCKDRCDMGNIYLEIYNRTNEDFNIICLD
jgi:hypothetical protein